MVTRPTIVWNRILTLTLQKSRVLQIQGVKGEAVVLYCEPLTTKEMRCPWLSRRVNNTAILWALLELTNSDVLKCL
jgi:hypothetical protein